MRLEEQNADPEHCGCSDRYTRINWKIIVVQSPSVDLLLLPKIDSSAFLPPFVFFMSLIHNDSDL